LVEIRLPWLRPGAVVMADRLALPATVTDGMARLANPLTIPIGSVIRLQSVP